MMDYSQLIPERVRALKPSGIRKFFDIAATMDDVLSLSIGEPDFVTPWVVRDAGIDSLVRGRTFYTSNAGLIELRTAICEYYARTFALSYTPEQALVTVGGSEAIDLCLRTLLGPGDEVIIPEPSFVCYEPITQLCGGRPVAIRTKAENEFRLTADELRAYMEWDVINQAANYLSDDVRAVSFGFYSQTMRGAKEDQPRWKRATSQVEGMMGEALGRIYCEKYFPASSKKRMEELIGNLQVALTERIKAQTWMSEPTKKNALDKLAAFYVKVGYPNTWKDLSALTIDPQKSYYENMLSCVTFWSNEAIEKKAGKPVDRDEWHMTPQTVNAYYNPTTNEICFPAGILQYPFFDPKADDAFNYGAIGVVIGHEMLHGFDDQGRHYDKDGNMHDWWTESDTKSFNERAEQYADFFSNIKVLPDLNANGHFTLGENLADHGGLQVSFYALKHATEGKKQKKLLGFTPEQRFFIAYSGVWAANITEKEIRSRTKSDPHALGEWRVNGALPHIDMWYDAFGVKPGDKMYLPKNERLELW